MTKANI